MEELVFKSEKGTLVTTSLLVAQKFGKEHKGVLDAIRNLTAENSAVKSLFYETTYISDRNREYPVFIMNRDGFSLLVMGFTGKDALKFKLDFIEAFNRMEKLLTSGISAALPNFNNPAEVARAWAQEYEQKQLAEQRAHVLEEEKVFLKQEVEELFPDTNYAKQVLKSTNTFTTTQIAKELGMSAERHHLYSVPVERYEMTEA